MMPQLSDEKIKPFRLVKYFTFASLIVIFAGTLVLTGLNTHWARTMQRKKSEDFALLLIENLNHQVYLQFIIPVFLKFGKIQLREKEQYEWMDKVVRSTLHSFNVDRVNIYDMSNIISYSLDPKMIGKKNVGGTGYLNAVAGKSTSRLIQRGNFLQILLGFPKETRVITFAPLRAERPPSRISGPVLGVVEIEQDLTDEYATIFRFQTIVIITSAVVMSALFLVLRLVVKRGEKIIEKRTLERIRLKEQLSRAERLSSLGEMAAGIAHEIRNPLGIIRSSAEHLKKKMADFDPENSIPDIIVEEASRLNIIVTDYLNFARPKPPNLVPCRVEEVLEKNISYISSQTQDKGYIMTKLYANNLPEIMADSAMLYQAFLNILINAIQAMPDGGEIYVQVVRNNNSVSILFEDEGEGIPEEKLEKIWDPFFTTKDMGTGLGLVVVKNIIDSHGGEIKIENGPVRGARVTIELPLHNAL